MQKILKSTEKYSKLLNATTNMSGYKKGTGAKLKIKDSLFGGLFVDVPRLLATNEVHAFKGGKLVYEAQGDQSTAELLTKKFNPKKNYSLQAVRI